MHSHCNLRQCGIVSYFACPCNTRSILPDLIKKKLILIRVNSVLALTNLAIFIVDIVKEAEIAKSGGDNQGATVTDGHLEEPDWTSQPFDNRAESKGIGAGQV